MTEKEPLLPYVNPRRKPSLLSSSSDQQHLLSSSVQLPLPPSLCALPEDEEVLLPSLPPSSPLTPSAIKDLLIFGPSSPSTTLYARSLAEDSFPSPPPSSSSSSHCLLESQPEQKQDGSVNTSTMTNLSFSWILPSSKSNLHRSKTAPAMAAINDLDHHLSKPSKFASPSRSSVIRQAAALLLVYLSLGVIIYSFNRKNFSAKETHPVVDALYFCIVTMCTIGYGDITPTTTSTKLFSIMFVLVGFGFIDIFLSGMVSYVLDLQENLLLTTVKSNGVGGDAGGKHEAKSYLIDVKKGRMRIRIKVGLALGVVILCIGVGTCVMHFMERLCWLDSFYLSVMSVTTVGYGDRAFNSLPGRIFASIWLLVSTLAVARAFLYLAEARIDKRHRMMAKWVLRQDMTVSEFLAADIDNNGFVSKSEFVIYKLKEMGKIAEKDILQICHQFDRLDVGNCGKITLATLMEK